jgi:DMSO/TMAO reductase YedYZ molybdopterin-dependent catalytic subunit
MTTRRALLRTAGSLALAGSDPFKLALAGLPAGATESALLDTLPGKQPLIKRSFRPPNYESPLSYLDGPITPNDKFFVRWHLAVIPTVDARTWRLKIIGGDAAERSFDLGLDELKREFEPVELVAVCQCAGNQRGLAEPHVPGVQWGSGAVGNARWRGVRLKDVLSRAKLKTRALEIAFDGADGPALPQTPDFTKSIPVWKGLDENTLIAYEMNGAPLPHWNGFPARMIVPGWAATYWVKQLTAISVLDKPLSSFWMTTAYRVPKGKYPVGDRFPSQESEASTPVLEIDLNSIVTNVADRQQFRVGAAVALRGIAWDSGTGIRRVEVSLDQGQRWQAATLGKDGGRFSFRSWHYAFTPQRAGALTLMIRATNERGAIQPQAWVANPAGYRNNVVQKLDLVIV